ncbi:MAG: hypothetical protein HQ543_06775 [Bacteroidetes bacterium]|nr:hypothetical protein [Bacteroidota bacterium]
MNKYALIQRNDNVGFFSHVQTTLEGIHDAIENNLIPVADYRKGMEYYRDHGKPHNIWDLYFEQPYKAEDIIEDFIIYNFDAVKRCPIFMRNNVFDIKRIMFLRPFVTKHLKVKTTILNRLDSIANKYDFNFDNTIGVCHRGTDRGETPHVEYARYLPVINKLLSANRKLRIYIQSDEIEFVDFIRSRYPNSFHILDFQISSKTGSVVHKTNKKSGYEMGIDCVLMMLLLSKCNYLVKNFSNLTDFAAYFKKDNNIIHIFSSQKEKFKNYLKNH